MHFINRKKGFTLIEMVVSLGIFTVVALIAVGALLKIVDANKKSQNLKSGINNMNFVLESMTRELRMGTNYYCLNGSKNINSGFDSSNFLNYGGCNYTNNSWTVFFNSQRTAPYANGTKVCQLITAYSYDDTSKKIYKAQQEGCFEAFTNNSYQFLVSPDIIIDDFEINTKVTNSSSYSRQPFIWLRLEGYVGSRENNKTVFNVQTSVSQRNLVYDDN